MAASIVDLGNLVFDRVTVGNCRPGTNLGGYMLVAADDLQGGRQYPGITGH